MKLIALKNIRNVPSLRLIEDGKSTVEGAQHVDHIHKGAVFEIGDPKLKLCAADLQKLHKLDPASMHTIALLFHAKAIGDANDEKVVADVKADIAEDDRREKNTIKQNQAASQSLAAQMAGFLKTLGLTVTQK